MASSEQRVIGYYLPDQTFVPLKPNQQPFFVKDGEFVEVTPANSILNLQDSDIRMAICWMTWLPESTRFCLGTSQVSPLVTSVAGYHDGNEYRPLSLGETAVYFHAGQSCRVTTLADVELARSSLCIPGIESAGKRTWLNQGTVFYLSAAAPWLPSPVQEECKFRLPMLPPPNFVSTVLGPTVQPKTCLGCSAQITKYQEVGPISSVKCFVALQEDGKLRPPPSPSSLFPLLSDVRGSMMRPKTCQDCQAQVLQYQEVGSVCCVKCLLYAITSGRCSTLCHNETPWSEGIICKVMDFLRSTLSDQEKAQLPTSIPLPRDHFVCIGKDKPYRPGYPPRGHIIGKAAITPESGCPNEHILCSICASMINDCPACGAFIAFEVIPQGCPDFPNSDQHCADFDRVCTVPGCTGGRWKKSKIPH